MKPSRQSASPTAIPYRQRSFVGKPSSAAQYNIDKKIKDDMFFDNK